MPNDPISLSFKKIYQHCHKLFFPANVSKTVQRRQEYQFSVDHSGPVLIQIKLSRIFLMRCFVRREHNKVNYSVVTLFDLN